MEVLSGVVHEEFGPLKRKPADEAPAEADDDGEDYDFQPVGEHPPCDEDVSSIMFIVPNDHDRIKGLYRRYRDPTDSPRQRQLLAYQMLRELTVHILAEEAILYPLVGEQIDKHMQDHGQDEHDSLKLFSADLEGMKLEDEGYEDKMHQLMETFLEHIHEEEHRMLPALRGLLDDGQLRELGKRFQDAKLHLPTRSHPGDPHYTPHVDDALVLLDAARDAALFEGTPPPLGSPSTEVFKQGTGLGGGPA